VGPIAQKPAPSDHAAVLLCSARKVDHNGLVRDMRPPAWGLAALGVAGLALTAVASDASSDFIAPVTGLITAPAIVLGLLLVTRRPRLVIGLALVALGVAPIITFALSQWGETAVTAEPMPGARLAGALAAGAWAWMYVPPTLLALTFPHGDLLSRRWRPAVVASLVIPAVLQVIFALDPKSYESGGGTVPGSPPLALPLGVLTAVAVVALAGLLATLVTGAVAIVKRYRTGDDVTRRQIRWFATSAALLPLVLAVCMVSVLVFGGPNEIVLVGLGVVLVSMPVGVAVAVLRHDLYDVDRLISRTLAATVVTAGLGVLFGVVVVVVGTALGRDSSIGVAVASLACAVAVSPLWRAVKARVDRRFYRDRHRAIGEVRAFVSAVRDGTAEPEEVEAVLASALADPEVSIAYEALPGIGEAADADDTDDVKVSVGGRPVATVHVGHGSRQRAGLLKEVLTEAHLPMEVARLRVELRHALAETEASRTRLVRAGDDERRRLERDLHDGAQQRLVALGMSLRFAERRLAPEDPQRAVLDNAVAQLREAVEDLRSVAQGLRPRGLDEGLPAALRDLVRTVPVPVDLAVDGGPVPDVVATTAYYVAAEGVANALKHAGPGRLRVDVTRTPDRVTVTVADDGAGGAVVVPGGGLAGLADRVAAAGGVLRVDSPNGRGTTVQAVLPCGS